jgi:AcrR family transcriptional regulator
MVWAMSERLTPEDWIGFALKTLAREGSAALKADVLARKLGVSRGSFYWHFTDLDDFHARVIAQWKHAATEAIITDIERYAAPEERLDALLRHAFGRGSSLEVRMRTWADSNAEAARAVSEIDRRRREYIERMLMEAGVESSAAATRAQLLYWAYLGAAFHGSRLAGESLERMVGELEQMAFGRVSGELNKARERVRRKG